MAYKKSSFRPEKETSMMSKYFVLVTGFSEWKVHIRKRSKDFEERIVNR